MKTKLVIFIFLLICINGYSQTPSINETKLAFKSKDSVLVKQIINNLNVRLLQIENERKTAEALVSNTTSTEDVKKENIVKIKDTETEMANTEAAIKVENQKIVSFSDNYKKVFDANIKKANEELNVLKLAQNEATSVDAMDIKMLEVEKKEKEINKIINDRYSKLKSLTYSAVLPSLNRKYRKEFFEATYNNDIKNTKYLNSISVAGDKSGAVVQSEIITDNISAFRISFGTVVTATSNNSETQNNSVAKADAVKEVVKETEQDAFKRLLNGGGNFYAELILPLLTTYDGNSSDLFTSYSYASFKGAMDIKGFGNNIDTSTGNGSFGINSYIGMSSDSKKFNFFLQGNINYSFGSNEFYKNLGIKNEQGFLNGKIIAGVTLLSTFKVTAIVNTFGSDEKLRSGKVIIGVQVLPGF
jgi:hypothetical protein